MSILIISIIVIFITTVIAGIYPFLNKKDDKNIFKFEAGEALACGVFLGAGLIHMLNDANADFNEIGFDYPFAFVITGFSFLFLLLLEHISRNEIENSNNNYNNNITVLSVTLLAIHSFLEGSALGVTTSLSVSIMLLIAILSHKWIASFAISTQINKSNFKLSIKIILFLIFALMTPIGIFIGGIINHDSNHESGYELLKPIITALSAGTFIYLGTLHGLKRAIMIDRCCNLKHFYFVIIGFSLMAILAIWT